MGILIDTSILIETERGGFEIERFLAAEAMTVPVYLATVTISELLLGVELASTTTRKKKRAASVESDIAAFPALSFGIPEARAYTKVWAELRKSGDCIGAHDMMIAATALVPGYRVATLNLKDFSRVKGLEVINASTYLLD